VGLSIVVSTRSARLAALSYIFSEFPLSVSAQYGLRGKDATAQFVALARTLDYSGMDFRCEVAVNHVAVFVNYAFWMQGAFSNQGVTKTEQERVMAAIQRIWSDASPEIHLPHQRSAVKPDGVKERVRKPFKRVGFPTI